MTQAPKTAAPPVAYPEELVTVCDPCHPGYAARDAALYEVGNDLFDDLCDTFFRSTLPETESVGMVQLPSMTFVNGAWTAIDGSKRIMAWREANKRRKAMGLPLVRIPFSIKAAAWSNGQIVAGHVAAQLDREVPDYYTRVRFAALLLSRDWEQAHVAGAVEPSFDEVATSVGIDAPLLKQALERLPSAAPSVVAAMRPQTRYGRGMSLTAALLFCRRPHEEQDAAMQKATRLAMGTPQNITARQAKQSLATGAKVPKRRRPQAVKASVIRRAAETLQGVVAAECESSPRREYLRGAMEVLAALAGRAPADLPDEIRTALRERVA